MKIAQELRGKIDGVWRPRKAVLESDIKESEKKLKNQGYSFPAYVAIVSEQWKPWDDEGPLNDLKKVAEEKIKKLQKELGETEVTLQEARSTAT